MKKEPVGIRLWRYVQKTEGCWLWTGYTTKPNRQGYGRICVEKKKYECTHRVSWQLEYGPIPDGLKVLHKCDVPLCVRPDHLFLGTQLENIKDRDQKGRTQKGETHCRAKLSSADVVSIRQRLAEGEFATHIARDLGVAYGTIQRIKERRGWLGVQ